MDITTTYSQLSDSAKILVADMLEGQLLGRVIGNGHIGRAWVEPVNCSGSGRQVDSKVAAELVDAKLLEIDSEMEECSYRYWRVKSDFLDLLKKLACTT